MLNITKQSDYGMLFISYLLKKKTFVPLSTLVKETKLPKRFLARIAAELVKHKVVESKEGKIGGYKISKMIGKVTLYDYLKIFEGDLALTKCCVDDKYKCVAYSSCVHKNYMRNTLTQIIQNDMKKYKLVNLFNK